jgi:hypothetical protein
MALSLSNLAISGGGNWPGETLRSYVVRYRYALYALPIAVVIAGVALEWHWLTASTLLRLVTALPCMLMMFNCMSCVTRGSTEGTAPAEKTLPSSTS